MQHDRILYMCKYNNLQFFVYDYGLNRAKSLHVVSKEKTEFFEFESYKDLVNKFEELCLDKSKVHELVFAISDS